MKLSIVGDAYVLTSTLKAEAITTVKKYKPDALKIKDKDGNDVFALSFNPGKPSISKAGFTFGGVSRDGGGFATITGTIPEGTKDAKEYVAELVGGAVLNVNTLEASIPVAYGEITAAKTDLLNSITVS